MKEEFRIGQLTLRPHRELLKGGVPVSIGGKALALLSFLTEARGALMTKDELMAAVWPGQIIEENALQAQVVTARKALGQKRIASGQSGHLDTGSLRTLRRTR